MPRALTLAPLPRGGKTARALAASVRGALRDGRLKAGEMLPSLRGLAGQLGVHWHTARAALQQLEAEGWLEALPRRGYRVLGAPDGDHPEGTEARPCGPGIKTRLGRDFGPERGDGGPYAVDFRWGHADLRAFPLDEFRAHWRDTLRRMDPGSLGYGNPRGHAPYLKQLEAYLRRRRCLLGRELLATQGSQEALHLVSQVLLKPGDTVAVERLSYGGALEVFKAAGVKVERVDLDENGMVPESLEALLKSKKIRLLYSTPLHQYPTTAVLGAPRRQRIYRTLSRHGTLLLEDDYDHEVHYRGQPQAPMAAFDPEGLILYTSSFSKVLLPSLRLGFLALPPRLGPAFAAARRVISRQGDTLTQAAMARWMAGEGFERHLHRVRRLSLERLDFIENALLALKARGLAWDWRRPDGGLALWLDLGVDSASLAQRAGQAGLGLLPEALFDAKGKGTHVRLGFARLNQGESARGLQLLATLCRGKAGGKA
jgi:GntR family transcriptional regulator/MocR family aminotransferase